MRFLLTLLLIAVSVPRLFALDEGDYVVVLNGDQDAEVVLRQHGIGRRPKTAGFHGDFTYKQRGYNGFSAHLSAGQANKLNNDTRVAVIEPDLSIAAIPSVSAAWAKGLGGAGADSMTAVTEDQSGNVYMAGYFTGQVSFGGSAIGTAGAKSLVVAKYDRAGAYQWAFAYLGTTTPNGICVDASGNVIVAGYYGGTATFGGATFTSTGQQDCFLVKYNSAGTHQWSHSYGNTNPDVFSGVAVDSTGNIDVTGYFQGSVSFGGAVITSGSGGFVTSIIAAQYTPLGTNVWSKTFSSLNNAFGYGVSVDPTNNIILTGQHFGTINWVVATNSTFAGVPPYFVTKLNSSGTALWAKRYGGGGGARSTSVAVDKAGNAVVGGLFTTSTDLGGGIVTGGGLDSNLFFAKYSGADGSYVWGHALAGGPGGAVNSVATDSLNNIVLAGYFYGTCDFGGQSLSSSGGSWDGFAAKYDSSGVLSWANSFGSTGTDQALSAALDPTGPVVLAGFFNGSITIGGTNLVSAGGQDGLLAQLQEGASSSTQVIPTGIRRIGCLSNTLWQASSVTPINADIAIVDTGIQLTHPDLNVFANTTFVAGTTTGNDDNGHGTHVAGIAGAKNNSIGVVGVAPGVRLWAVKVLAADGTGSLSQIIAGVNYVTDHASEIEVANMSLGGQGVSDSLRLAIQNSVAKGVFWVVAAGNSNFEIYGGDRVFGTSDDFFPASYPEVMAVGALCDTDGLHGGVGSTNQYGLDDSLASFSSYSLSAIGTNVYSPGAGIDLAAPGVAILSTTTNSSYATLSGTSMASPHAAGAVALYIVSHSKPTTAAGVYAIRQAMVDTVEPQSTWGRNPTDPQGRLFDFNPEGLVDVRPATQTNFTALAITSPANGASVVATNQVHFTGTAVDAVDGDLGTSVTWTDPVLGHFGTGTNFFYAFTNSYGSHVITARVSNSNGGVTNKTVQINITAPVVTNTPPSVVITTPTNGASIWITNIPPFVVSATDPVDGDISADAYWYYYDSGGCVPGCVVGHGSPVTITFAAQGYYTLWVTATNSHGLAGTNAVQFFINAGQSNAVPVIGIQTPATGATYTNGAPIVFVAVATDDFDGNMGERVTWKSSKDGAFGSGTCLTSSCLYAATTNSSLSLGTHTITATVIDTAWGGFQANTNSAFIVINVTTNNTTLPKLVTTVTTPGSTYRWRQKTSFTAHVTSSSTNVPNAAVQFEIKYAKYGKQQVDRLSGTTDSSGNVTVAYTVASQNPSPQTDTVAAIATKTNYQSATGTTTFQVIK